MKKLVTISALLTLFVFFNIIFILNIQESCLIDKKSIENQTEKDHCPTNMSLSSNNPFNYEWYRKWGQVGVDECNDIAIDSSDNIYLVGKTRKLYWDGYDISLLKYNSTGDLQWSYIYGVYGKDDVGNGIALDSSGNIYIGGYTNSYGAGGFDMYLMMCNSSGELQWDITWGGSLDDRCRDIMLDPLGNIYLGGDIMSYGAGERDLCVVKFDDQHNYEWNKTWGGTSDEWGNTLALDSSGNVYLGGFTSSYGSGSYDICVVEYDFSGTQQWELIWGGASGEQCTALVTDSQDNLYVAGSQHGDNHFDFFFLKYNSTKDLKMERHWGGSDRDYCNSINLDSSGNIYLGGYTETYGGPDQDICLIKYNTEGMLKGNDTWGGTLHEECFTISFDSQDNIFLGGYTESYAVGSKDQCLIKYDNLYPHIKINSPTSLQLFGPSSPDFDLFVAEADIDSTWYTTNGSENYFFEGMSGNINQMQWDSFENGIIIIKFYINNSMGYTTHKEVTVRKDKNLTELKIISPKPFTLCGNSTPSFELSYIEANLKEGWYSLNNGENYTFNDKTGFFNKTAWNSCKNGTVLVKFFANNSVGNLEFEEVNIRKDICAPKIAIILPKNESYCKASPKIKVIVFDSDYELIWYNVTGNSTKIFIYNNTEVTLDSFIWKKLDQSMFKINFYINDSVGNINNTFTMKLFKDTVAPEIFVDFPSTNEEFQEDPPKFNITVDEINLNKVWYTINDGTTKYFLLELNGTINQTAWVNLKDGTISLKFWANDTAGNLIYKEILVKKIIPPHIDDGDDGGGNGGGDGGKDDKKSGANEGSDFLSTLMSPVGLVIVGSITACGIIGVIVVIKKVGAAKVRK
ncbi:MAG: SBBP repeat-containing protein [Promethearchaeota archaeon]